MAGSGMAPTVAQMLESCQWLRYSLIMSYHRPMGMDDDARAAWGCITRTFLSNELHERFHDACTSIGLPHPGALKLLLQLDAEQPPAMRSIAGIMGCDASYVTALVDALEEPGYVERRVSPTDRRVKLVALTSQGVAAREKALDVMSEPPAGFARLSAPETKELARLLAKVTR
jgi:DNA-binding MarR family transcriptional regulator